MVKKEVEGACSCKECGCGACCLLGKALVLILAVVGCVAAIMACIYACRTYKLNVLSAGGKENLQKMNELYSSDAYINYATEQTQAYIDNFMSQFGTNEATTNEENGDEATVEGDNEESNTEAPEFGSEGTLSAEDVVALKEKGVIYGPENAKITILEFADASCGYCKRQIAQDKTVDAVMEQYPNDVNVIFKNFPIFNETAAEAMACSQDQLSADNYHKFIVAVFSADDATSVDALAELAASFGADKSKMSDCVNNGEKADEVSATMAEGQSFGISGTPSSVIINNESGEFSLIPGAYPASTFVETIEALLS